MDSKALRMAILLSCTALVLILLVVYAANVGKKWNRGQADAQGTEAVSGASGAEDEGPVADEAYLTEIGNSFRAFGEQIGSQPKAFLYDESFFDPMRDVGRGISEGNEEVLSLQAAVQEDVIHVSILNSRGGLESGVAFQVLAEQVQTGKEKTWTDTDRDGQIDLTGQANGNYRLHLLEVQGYEIPTAAVVVKVEAAVKPATGASSETGATGSGASASTADTADSGATTADTGSTESATTGGTDTAGAGASGTGSTDMGADRW
ncbi:MAG: hypothetical protein K6G16_07680 [Lachnospiraceae bacterium]|nr:hypothetical protein [Lachnospiraceae bacterium]